MLEWDGKNSQILAGYSFSRISMSRHVFETVHEGQYFSITMGWDVPIQGYFMVIETRDDGDQPFYSNLNDIGFTQDLSYYLNVLKHFGLTVPTPMLDELVEDAKNNIQDKLVAHEITKSGEYCRW